ncbi:MAG TPA: hypothetical protein VH458_00385, partial [Vicinamibacterales bacterium]
MTRSTWRVWIIGMAVLCLSTVGVALSRSKSDDRQDSEKRGSQNPVLNAAEKIRRGQHTFRFDTFG